MEGWNFWIGTGFSTRNLWSCCIKWWKVSTNCTLIFNTFQSRRQIAPWRILKSIYDHKVNYMSLYGHQIFEWKWCYLHLHKPFQNFLSSFERKYSCTALGCQVGGHHLPLAKMYPGRRKKAYYHPRKWKQSGGGGTQKVWY